MKVTARLLKKKYITVSIGEQGGDERSRSLSKRTIKMILLSMQNVGKGEREICKIGNNDVNELYCSLIHSSIKHILIKLLLKMN